jgi:hypothetical protein
VPSWRTAISCLRGGEFPYPLRGKKCQRFREGHNGGGNSFQGHGGTALIYTDGQDSIDNNFATTSLVTIAP